MIGKTLIAVVMLSTASAVKLQQKTSKPGTGIDFVEPKVIAGDLPSEEEIVGFAESILDMIDSPMNDGILTK